MKPYAGRKRSDLFRQSQLSKNCLPPPQTEQSCYSFGRRGRGVVVVDTGLADNRQAEARELRGKPKKRALSFNSYEVWA